MEGFSLDDFDICCPGPASCVKICGTIHTQNLAWSENPHRRNSRIKFKINGQRFFKTHKESVRGSQHGYGHA